METSKNFGEVTRRDWVWWLAMGDSSRNKGKHGLVGGPSKGTERQVRQLRDPGWDIQAQLLVRIEMPGGKKRNSCLPSK